MTNRDRQGDKLAGFCLQACTARDVERKSLTTGTYSGRTVALLSSLDEGQIPGGLCVAGVTPKLTALSADASGCLVNH